MKKLHAMLVLATLAVLLLGSGCNGYRSPTAPRTGELASETPGTDGCEANGHLNCRPDSPPTVPGPPDLPGEPNNPP